MEDTYLPSVFAFTKRFLPDTFYSRNAPKSLDKCEFYLFIYLFFFYLPPFQRCPIALFCLKTNLILLFIVESWDFVSSGLVNKIMTQQRVIGLPVCFMLSYLPLFGFDVVPLCWCIDMNFQYYLKIKVTVINLYAWQWLLYYWLLIKHQVNLSAGLTYMHIDISH